MRRLTALEGFRIRQSPRHQPFRRKVNWNHITILILRKLNIETPQSSSNVDKQAFLGDMETWTYPSPPAKAKVVSFCHVGSRGVFRGGEWVILESIRNELCQIILLPNTLSGSG